MLYVGIDIAKNKHDFYITGTNKEKLVGPITIKNNIEGFALMAQTIRGYSGQPKTVHIGMESTGHYGYNLIHFLYEQGFKICIKRQLYVKPKRIKLTLKCLPISYTQKEIL